MRTPIRLLFTLLCPAIASLVVGHGRAAGSESSSPDVWKSARVEFSQNQKRIGGREVAGFSARQALAAQQENLTPPAGLNPVEQEAWRAMARRQGASGGVGLASFYPVRYGEPFVVEGQGVRVAVRPVGGSNVGAQIENGQVIYRNAYPETDSVHVIDGARSEEFLFLQSECAPREFAYEISELSAGTRVELMNGEVRFTDKAGRGVKIEAPWLVEANGALRADAMHWELDATKPAAGPQRLRLLVEAGLRYPVLIDPSWVPIGSMRDVREYHTATLLPSGKVLVAGGLNADFGGDSLKSAELYDPASGTWTATGSMGTPRFAHTATLLPSGKVLVVAGYDTSSPSFLTTAELYDPASGTWTATGSLGTARYVHTATLLPSGQVLVAGGYNYPDFNLFSAELYDPASGTWTATGSMRTARQQHTATLLASGKVLVAGGGSVGILSSAELYDPASGTWTTTGSMRTARITHTETLLPSGKVLVAGGIDSSGTLSSAELYDPAVSTWMATGSMGFRRSRHTATLLLSGKVLVAAGVSESYLSSAERYDPASGTWTAIGSLGTARYLHTATLLASGKVLVAGGNYIGVVLNSAELLIRRREAGRRPVPLAPQ